jgi:hypothetical protein
MDFSFNPKIGGVFHTTGIQSDGKFKHKSEKTIQLRIDGINFTPYWGATRKENGSKLNNRTSAFFSSGIFWNFFLFPIV